jgi:hypothetical protein
MKRWKRFELSLPNNVLNEARPFDLMIGSENAGDFHDWPETWQRASMLSQEIKI